MPLCPFYAVKLCDSLEMNFVIMKDEAIDKKVTEAVWINGEKYPIQKRRSRNVAVVELEKTTKAVDLNIVIK